VLPKIRNLFNDELSKDTSPKQVNIDNVLPKIRNLFNDELSKDTSPKQVNIDNVLPKIRNLFNDELSKDTSPKHINIDNVLPKIRNLFNDELSKDTSPKYTKQSAQDQPKISTGAVTGLKDRIAKFEADSDSKIKKYWTEEKKQTVEKHSQYTQDKDTIYHTTPKKLNINEITHDFKLKDNTKDLKDKFEKGFDSNITRYWTSPEEWDKWEKEKQKGTGKENELIRPRTKFAIEHSKDAQSKDNAPKRQIKTYIEASEDTHIKEGNTQSLKDKFENLAKEAKQIGTQAQQKSKSSSNPSIKPTGRGKDGRNI
ncbi:MAG TPA: hypothetical protein LFW20_07395, partial [Rickettsia endosymbiont of Omalisus fontisbellaquei]|nr:hypothetical protein [Rickettsia endosymbiont of Omalisus fontisbellaquei]